MQATFKDMKAEVTQEQSMFNYNIKAKHMNAMTCFLASKNFELNTRKPSPPPYQNKAGEPKSAGVPKTPVKVEKKVVGSGGDSFARNNST